LTSEKGEDFQSRASQDDLDKEFDIKRSDKRSHNQRKSYEVKALASEIPPEKQRKSSAIKEAVQRSKQGESS